MGLPATPTLRPESVAWGRRCTGRGQVFLNEVSARHQQERIIMWIDGAGWHRSDKLKAPANLFLLKLPPFAPEINPIEHV